MKRNKPAATTTSKATQPHFSHGRPNHGSTGASASSSVHGTSSNARTLTTTMGPRVNVRQPKPQKPVRVKADSASSSEISAPCVGGYDKNMGSHASGSSLPL